MPDVSPVLRRRIDPLPMPAGALDVIRRRARTRRLRRLTVGTSGAIAAVVAAGALLYGGEAQDDSLEVVPAQPRPTATAVAPAAASRPAAVPRALPATPKVHTRTAPVASVPDATASRLASRAPVPSVAPTRVLDQPATRQPVAGTKSCSAEEGGPNGGWCLQTATGGTRTADPRDLILRQQVCRQSDLGPGTLTWTTTQQVGVTVYDAARRVRWTYHPPSQRAGSSEMVLPSVCVVWDLDWHSVDNAGRSLPTGTYVVEGVVLSDELSGHASRFSLTLE